MSTETNHNARPLDPALARYSRQVLYDNIGEAGQIRLGKARAVLFGCGALGTVLANTLVRAGVGHLRICDRDFIERDNLQRQVLFDEHDIEANTVTCPAGETLKPVGFNDNKTSAKFQADANACNADPRITGMSSPGKS